MPIPTRMAAAALVACLASSSGVIAQGRESSGETAATGGWVAYLDINTGKLVDGPDHGKTTLRLSPQELYMFSNDDFGLFEQVMPDGSIMINLQGRFREATVATLNEDGTTSRRYIGGEMYSSETGKLVQEHLQTEFEGHMRGDHGND